MSLIIVQTTFSDKKEAKAFARNLIEKKLCGCVQMRKITSFYTWEGKICEEKEWLLAIKTKKEKFELIQREIKENHSYDLPEILEIEVTNTSKEYLKFIGESII